MKITIKNTLAFLAFVGTLTIALPVFGQAPAVNVACPDFGYAKLDGQNNTDQVSNLQTFLKSAEGLDVDVTGTFDQKTEQAVETFQKKYMSDIMSPWDATRASGVVNLTTVKKIKQLMCGQPLTLNANELYAIALYESKAGETGSAVSVDAQSLGLDQTAMSDTNGIMNDKPQNTATAVNSGGASLFHRFLSFVKHIFVR